LTTVETHDFKRRAGAMMGIAVNSGVNGSARE
jgi:hypothetical protein